MVLIDRRNLQSCYRFFLWPKRELLHSCGYFLYPLSPALMPHSNKALFLFVSVSYINFICALTTKVGTLTMSTKIFHLNRL